MFKYILLSLFLGMISGEVRAEKKFAPLDVKETVVNSTSNTGGTTVNLGQILLDKGVWLVSAAGRATKITSMTYFVITLNTTLATAGTAAKLSVSADLTGGTIGEHSAATIPTQILRVSSPTTYYLVAQSNVNNVNMTGFLTAIKMQD